MKKGTEHNERRRNNKRKKTRILSLIICLGIALSAVSCGGGGSEGPDQDNNRGNGGGDNDGKGKTITIDTSKPVTLTVDLHGWTPSINDTPTAENPTVFRSPQVIADAFTKMYPNVTIEFVRTKPIGTEEECAQWFTTQIAAGKCPAIAFSWGTAYQSRDWYLPLDEYLDMPNQFIEGNEHWRDAYPEYLWKNHAVANGNGNVVSIPVTLYPGPATGYYYNKEIFAEVGITKLPATLEELIEVSHKLEAAGYIGIAPYEGFSNVTTDQWITQFIVGPAVGNYIMDQVDYDGSGSIEVNEQLRGVKAGLYDPVTHDYAKEVWVQMKRYFNEVLENGWETTDYWKKWSSGEVGIVEDGLWRMTNENNNTYREFEYGIFPCVLMSDDTTEYAKKIEMTESGPYQPDPDLGLNIMKDAVEGDENLLNAAILFLQFLTTPENVTSLVQENKVTIGAVKGAEAPAQLAEWLSQPFPKVPVARWPIGFTTEQNTNANKVFETWVKGGMKDDEFYNKMNEIQQTGADEYIKSLNMDTSGW